MVLCIKAEGSAPPKANGISMAVRQTDLNMGSPPEGEHGRPDSHRAGESQTKRHARAGVLCQRAPSSGLSYSACLLPRMADQFRADIGTVEGCHKQRDRS